MELSSLEARSETESEAAGSTKKRGRPKTSSQTESKTTRKRRKSRKETSESEGETSGAVPDKVYKHWKSSTPLLYDFLVKYELENPSSSCRWGPPGDFARVCISEQAYRGFPDTLVLVDFKVAPPNKTSPEHVYRFEDDKLSPYDKKFKTLVHPGKVSRIRTLPEKPNIVATHSFNQVFIWNLNTQTNRSAVKGAAASVPDLLLKGNDYTEQFALALSKTGHVLSGGLNTIVTLWNIGDQISTLGVSGSGSDVGNTLWSQSTFEGHTDTVKDVQFHPKSAQQFCSVGDDRCLLLWDARDQSKPTNNKVKRNDAFCCVDWNPHNENYILAGSDDSSVCVFDRRKLPDHVYKFEHEAPVRCVQWCPDRSSVFGSSGDDRFIKIWDYEKADNEFSGLVFRHCGHRDKVVDFEWKVNDPFTLVSLSHNIEKTGGGALQIWRIKPWSLI